MTLSFSEAFTMSPLPFLASGMAAALGLSICGMAIWVVPRHPRFGAVFGALACLMGLASMTSGYLGHDAILGEVHLAASMASLGRDGAASVTQAGERLAIVPLSFGIGLGILTLVCGVVVVTAALRAHARARRT